jgi:AraC-like DNA-binding protein
MGSMAPVEGVLQQILNITAQAQPEFFTSEKLSALFSLLILELGQMAGFFSSSTEDRHITLDLKRNFLIDSFLNTHFQMRGGEQILADELHLSCRQLSRILTSLYGMGYREKVQEIRLAVSLDLLKHSSKSISEISELVGYDSPSSFCSFIKKSTGLTAGEIQKSARATSP